MAMKTPQQFLLLAALIMVAVLVARQRPAPVDNNENSKPAEASSTRVPSSAPDERSNESVSPPPVSAPGDRKNEKRDQALARLQSVSKQIWQPVFDHGSGRLRTLESGSLEILANDGNAGLVQIAQGFVERFAPDLFNVKPENLHFDKIVEMDRSKVIFEQYLDGRRVLGATLALIYESGALVRVQSDLVAESLARSPGTDISVEQALSYAILNGGEKLVARTDRLTSTVKPVASIKPELIYFPGGDKLISAYAIFVDRFDGANERVDRVRLLVDAVSPHIIRTDRMTIN